jgi:hypothetical protein
MKKVEGSLVERPSLPVVIRLWVTLPGKRISDPYQSARQIAQHALRLQPDDPIPGPSEPVIPPGIGTKRPGMVT